MAVAVHTRQTSHLPCIIVSGPAQFYPRNYEQRFGSYYETFVQADDVRFRRSYYTSPPFAWEIVVTNTADCSFPWQYMLPWRRIVLLYTRAGADTWITTSDSEGQDWEVPVLSIAGGVKAYGAVDPFNGTEVIAAYITATGKIGMRRRTAGASAFEAQVNIKDSAGADMLFENDTFSFHVGYEGPGRWMGHFHIQGEAATSTWWSADSCASWTRFI